MKNLLADMVDVGERLKKFGMVRESQLVRDIYKETLSNMEDRNSWLKNTERTLTDIESGFKNMSEDVYGIKDHNTVWAIRQGLRNVVKAIEELRINMMKS